MKKLLKKVLTDKAVRNVATLSAFVLTVVSTSTSAPWSS